MQKSSEVVPRWMRPVRELDDDAHKELGNVFTYECMSYIMDIHHKHTLTTIRCVKCWSS